MGRYTKFMLAEPGRESSKLAPTLLGLRVFLSIYMVLAALFFAPILFAVIGISVMVTEDEAKILGYAMGVVVLIVPALCLSAITLGLLWKYPPAARGWLGLAAIFVMMQGAFVGIVAFEVPLFLVVSLPCLGGPIWFLIVASRDSIWDRENYGKHPGVWVLVLAAVIPLGISFAIVGTALYVGWHGL
ncbi:hypothetical protein [Haloglycomyces albus]|uniref:hypothetical protein n=1 Tax=Haloglycomyces albus TaxID=526067 RepID=UPI0012EC7FA6|nr:hypothetical protein [Haloglycomyces albus]